MLKVKQLTQALLVTLAATVLLVTAQAQTLSKIPLLTQSGTVEPNLVLMFDDSASMPAQFIYQFGGSEGVYGRDGPGSNSNTATCSGTLSMIITCAYTAPSSTKYAQISPDVNGLTYDPRIRYKPRVDSVGSTTAALTAVGTPPTTTFYVYFYKNSSGSNTVWPGSGPDPLLVGSYFSGSTYVPAASLLISGATTGLAYPTSIATGGGPYPRFINRTDCNGGAATGGSCSLAEERLNYAIWQKYHSNRLDLAKTGLGYAFQNLTATLRLGWSTINQLDSTSPLPDTASAHLDSGVGLYDATRKAAFYTWLYARTGTIPGTPNRQALKSVGNYFSRADNKGPWAKNPDPASTGVATLTNALAADTRADRKAHYSCRRSYGMLVTDGYYNDNSPAVGDVDGGGTTISTITGSTASGTTLTFNYSPTAPYAQTQAETLADVAMKYWITDLRPGLTSDTTNDGIDNKVKVIPDTVVSGVTTKGNESFWQNMGFYAVGLGVNGTLNTSTALNFSTGTYPTWPSITFSSTGDETTIDDMWHATINARGRLLSAKNSDALSDAVEGMLAEINKVTDSQSGVAASTASLISGTRKYSPLYTTGSWVGNVIATNLDPASAADTCIAWQVTGPVITGPNVAPACTGYTTNGIPAYTSRKIYAWNGTAYGNFDSSNTHVTSNVVGGTSANLINYLRGDQSNEDTASTTNLYRKRESLLGDIVNSTPTFIQGALDMGYSSLPTGTLGQANYKAFVDAKAARTEGVLFAGANDGMLHGFRNSNGAEVFAFVPRAVMPNLHLLASRSYNHTYYVDGTTVEADACLGTLGKNCTSSEWKNLLLGSLGAGGKSVFALDVTTLTPSATMGLGASNILWEITTSTSGYANLGNTLSDIQTGVTTSGQWVAVFGNGYYGADGKAHLYVADLATGALLKDIDTGVGSGNGLSGATLVRDANQRIIGAYAGDLKGNMWKFDLSSSSASNWALGLSSSPLYAATSSKPITAPPSIVTHPSGGRVVTFGTGKFFDAEDTAAPATAQTFYGVWDSVAFGDPIPSTPTGVTQTGITNLVQQTISSATTGTYVATKSDLTTQTVTFTAYKQSKNTIDWTTKRGWYMTMPFTSERLVYPMANLFGPTSRLVLANTLAPSAVADPCSQAQSGSGWSYVFDLLTGSRPDNSIYPNCVDCNITTTPPIPPVVVCNGTKCFSLNPTEPECTLNCTQPPLQKFCGAQTGIACPGLSVKRSWRQVFLR